MVESTKRPSTQGPLLPIPDPVVIRNDSPCKALKLLDDKFILLGFDSGDIKVYDRKTLDLLSTQQVLKFPVLKLSRAMIAILAQHKDPQGTLLVMKPPDSRQGFTMEVVYKLETLVQSFTLFTSTVMQLPGSATDQILIAMPAGDKP